MISAYMNYAFFLHILNEDGIYVVASGREYIQTSNN
jgi:hypothetical protein